MISNGHPTLVHPRIQRNPGNSNRGDAQSERGTGDRGLAGASAVGRPELLGLENFAGIAAERSFRGKGWFHALKHIDVTAIFFPPGAPEHEIKDALGGEYGFVPNGPMCLSGISNPGATVSTSAPPGGAQWPGVSGVPMAHRGGTSRADVLLGVLDTGIDADHEEFVYQTIPFSRVSAHPGEGVCLTGRSGDSTRTATEPRHADLCRVGT